MSALSDLQEKVAELTRFESYLLKYESECDRCRNAIESIKKEIIQIKQFIEAAK